MDLFGKSESQIRNFIYRNMSDEMLRGLEHDDPKVIKRALQLFGVSESEVEKLDKPLPKEGSDEDTTY